MINNCLRRKLNIKAIQMLACLAIFYLSGCDRFEGAFKEVATSIGNKVDDIRNKLNDSDMWEYAKAICLDEVKSRYPGKEISFAVGYDPKESVVIGYLKYRVEFNVYEVTYQLPPINRSRLLDYLQPDSRRYNFVARVVCETHKGNITNFRSERSI